MFEENLRRIRIKTLSVRYNTFLVLPLLKILKRDGLSIYASLKICFMSNSVVNIINYINFVIGSSCYTLVPPFTGYSIN